MVTLKDIAERCKVSVATVSKTMSNDTSKNNWVGEKTRNKIRQAAREMGYRADDMARSIRTGKSKILAYVQESIAADFFNGLADKAGKNGYSIEPLTVNRLDPGYLENIIHTILTRRIAGVSVSYNLPSALKLINKLKNLNIPYILTTRLKNMPEDICYSDANNRHGVELALEHLYSLGHRDFLYLSVCGKGGISTCRKQYFNEFLAKKGGNVRKVEIIGNNKFPFERFKKIILGHNSRPTAIFCSEWVAAVVCISELGKLGFNIPQDISVVSYGNVSIASFMNPQITSVDERGFQGGKFSAQTLIKMIKGKTQLAETFLDDTELIIRESTAKVNLK